MKSRFKMYFKLNLMSLVFILVSFISVTLAWFAYSGIAKVETDINVKAWYIELTKNESVVSNDIVISLSDIYPGMETLHEEIVIKNKGDSDAQVNYQIVSARILGDAADNYVINGTDVLSDDVEDLLSHDYPFHINMNLSKKYANSGEDESVFDVSISWPLDSDNNILDSEWGNKAYLFQQNENSLRQQDGSYQIRSSIKIVISLIAEQYLESPTSSDIRFNLGDPILYDVVSNHSCSQLSDTCILTYVIDNNSTLGDTTLSLLPDPRNEYTLNSFDNYDSSYNSLISTWTVPSRKLQVSDLLKVVSNDVLESQIVRENISNLIIGKATNTTSIQNLINMTTSFNGYYIFKNLTYPYFSTANCYWTETAYDSSLGFAVKKDNDDITKMYGLANTNMCNIVPIIVADKINIST